MPMLWAAIIGGFLQVIGSIVGRVLIALGVGYATYSGIDLALEFFRNLFIAQFNSVGSFVTGFAGLLKLDICLGILISAATVKFTLNGVMSGTMKRFVLK